MGEEQKNEMALRRFNQTNPKQQTHIHNND